MIPQLPGFMRSLFASAKPSPAPVKAQRHNMPVDSRLSTIDATMVTAVSGTTEERVLGTYEAARWTADRSWLQAYVQDAGQDLDEGTRLEVLRRARYHEKNSPVFQRVLDLLETNVVGTGLLPTPTSSSPEFNQQAAAWFTRWATHCDLAEVETFGGMQSKTVRAMAVDGENFINLCKDDTGRPRIQLIESHRIVSSRMPDLEEAGMTEQAGVIHDALGRRRAYLFGAPNGPTVTAIPASQIVHFAEPARAGQVRGLSLFHACLTTIQDLHELQKLEMLCAKSAALHAFVFKRQGGEATGDPANDADTIDQLRSESAALAAAGYDPARMSQLRTAIGGQTVFLNEGEDLDQTKNDRPSAAMREFWEYLTSLVARAVGLSRAALHDYEGWSGPALRAAIVSDNRFYQVRTAALTDRLQKIYVYAIGWAIEHKEITAPAPIDWDSTRWHAPRRPTIDVGRDSKANLDELARGVRTLRDLLGEMGLDWREVVTQRTEEIAFIQSEAARLKLSPEALQGLLGIEPPPKETAATTPAK